MKKIESIKKSYERACNDYVAIFCKKQELDFEFWVADKVGEWAVFGTYSFTLSDIILDLETNQKKGVIIKWQEEGMQAHFENRKIAHINYQSYIMGMTY